MSNPLRLSYSAVSTYQACPQKYKLARIDKLVPIYGKSSFLFGTALDDTSEYVLLNLKEYSREDARKLFIKNLSEYDLYGKTVHPGESDLIRYSNGEIQPELLDEDRVKEIQSFAENLDIIVEDVNLFITDFRKLTKGGKKIDKPLQIVYNNICWHSIVVKGLILLENLMDWIDDNVVETHSVQKKIEIVNEVGDKFVGYCDFEVTIKNGDRIIYDLKTSSNAKKYYLDGVPSDSIVVGEDGYAFYDGDILNAASESFQLGCYSQELKNSKIAYLVFDKKIRVRDPKTRTFEIRGNISEDHLDSIFDQIDIALQGIKAEEFEKNTDSCFQFGKCEYYNYCNSNGSNTNGLFYKDKK